MPVENTLLIGFNPGFGSGYDKLLHSWARDIVMFLGLGYQLVFTQASDFSDLRGETAIWKHLFDDKAKVLIPSTDNKFRAATHYTDEGGNGGTEGVWCCANTNFYGF